MEEVEKTVTAYKRGLKVLSLQLDILKSLVEEKEAEKKFLNEQIKLLENE
jgi:hypothetical protein